MIFDDEARRVLRPSKRMHDALEAMVDRDVTLLVSGHTLAGMLSHVGDDHVVVLACGQRPAGMISSGEPAGTYVVAISAIAGVWLKAQG